MILAFVIVLVVVGVAVKACYETASDPTRFVEIVDELPIPAAWASAHTDVRRDMIMSGPRASRYYLVDADPEVIADATKGIIRSVGFELDPARPSTCRPNGEGGPVTCQLAALRGDDHLWITIFDRSDSAMYYLDQVKHLGPPGLSVLRITAEGRY